MKVLVDTSVWSVALRHKRPDSMVTEILATLVEEGRVAIIGPVRQEVLSGIRNQSQYKALKSKLSAFPDIALSTAHFELAAEFFNRCRGKGVQGAHTDFLIASVGSIEDLSIFTVDKDFKKYMKYLPIKVLSVGDFRT